MAKPAVINTISSPHSYPWAAIEIGMKTNNMDKIEVRFGIERGGKGGWFD
jgi:hypothetical protein